MRLIVAAVLMTYCALTGCARARSAPVVIEKTVRDTLTAVEMNVGDELRFTLGDGTTRPIILKKTWALVTDTTTT